MRWMLTALALLASWACSPSEPAAPVAAAPGPPPLADSLAPPPERPEQLPADLNPAIPPDLPRQEADHFGRRQEERRGEFLSEPDSGGRRFLIELDDPWIVRAEAVNLDPGTRILGLVVDGTARAYPLENVFAHGVVNDMFGDQPVALTA